MGLWVCSVCSHQVLVEGNTHALLGLRTTIGAAGSPIVRGLEQAVALVFPSPIVGAVSNLRSCLVSFTDTEGSEHTVHVPAESLYEAAVEAIAAFRHSVLAEMPLDRRRY